MNTVSRTDVNFQLRQPIGQIAMLTRIAVYQAINANQNPRSSDTIFKSVDPVSILVCRLDARLLIKACGLRLNALDIQNGFNGVAI